MKNFLFGILTVFALMVGFLNIESASAQRVDDGWSSSQWSLVKMLKTSDTSMDPVARKVWRRQLDFSVTGALASGSTRSLQGTIPDESTLTDCYVKTVTSVTASTGAAARLDVGCDSTNDVFNGLNLHGGSADVSTAGVAVSAATHVHIDAECTPTVLARLGNFTAGKLIFYCAYDQSE